MNIFGRTIRVIGHNSLILFLKGLFTNIFEMTIGANIVDFLEGLPEQLAWIL